MCDTHAHIKNNNKPSENTPGKEDAFHHVEVLHQHISLRLGAEVANSISNTQLDGPLQGRGGGLEAENREENNRVRCGWEIVGEIVMQKKPTDGVKYKNLRQTERQIKRKKLTFLYVVSPEASTLLWPIFFSWAGPTPNGDGICHEGKKREMHMYFIWALLL